MYGNIGLSSAKGSGTSGYVQKSLAYVGNKYQTTSNYKEVLQKFKDNPAPQKKKANNEIIEHELKHKIEVELYMLGEKLKEDKRKDIKQIEEEITKKRAELYSNLRNDENMLINNKETHQQSKLKDDQMEKMKNALNVNNEYEFGTAFDVELQEEKRQKRLLEKKEEKRKMKKILRQKRKKRNSRSRSGSGSHSQSRSKDQQYTKHTHKKHNNGNKIEKKEKTHKRKNEEKDSNFSKSCSYSSSSSSSSSSLSYSKSNSETKEHHKKQH